MSTHDAHTDDGNGHTETCSTNDHGNAADEMQQDQPVTMGRLLAMFDPARHRRELTFGTRPASV